MNLLIALILALVFCGSSFAQSKVKQSLSTYESIDNPAILTSDCDYPDCLQKVEEIKSLYQAQANESCREIYICIVCCNGGWVTYASVIIRPKGFHCEDAKELLRRQ